eukprot:6814182-Pyramimonas_sp.AAC.1
MDFAFGPPPQVHGEDDHRSGQAGQWSGQDGPHSPGSTGASSSDAPGRIRGKTMSRTDHCTSALDGSR